jgi:hypothetical protein
METTKIKFVSLIDEHSVTDELNSQLNQVLCTYLRIFGFYKTWEYQNNSILHIEAESNPFLSRELQFTERLVSR